MSHECVECGMQCDCDGEDMDNPQPPECQHLTGPEPCWVGFDEEAFDDLD